ncbi:MAG: CopD family protein [Gemmatimonadota bacterium]|nr:MAG: CopD family protein [Gemmatimonadota bacterium]
MNQETLAFAYGAIGRWLSYLAIVTTLGAAGYLVFIKPALALEKGYRKTETSDRVTGIALIAALALLCSTGWQLYAQAYSVFGIDETVTWEHLRIVTLETTWGTGWLGQAAAAGFAVVLLALATVMRRKRAIFITVAAIAAAVTVPLTGHALSATSTPWLTVSVQAMHVVGVGLWIGTLFVVVATLRSVRGPLALAALKAFTPLAVAAVAIVAVSGSITAIIYLDSPSMLWTTLYGRTLLLKLTLFTAVGTLGAYNSRLLQKISNRNPLELKLTVGGELLIAGLALAVTAILVALALSHN